MPKKGYIPTKEHIEKIAAFHRGRKRSKETRLKMSNALKSIYAKGETTMGFRTYPPTKETRLKASNKLKGRKNPKQSEYMKTHNPMFDLRVRFFGQDNPATRPEVRKKMSLSMKGRFMGENNPNWKGGFVRARKVIGTHTEQEWFELKRRYGFKCRCCGRKEPIVKLEKDHIFPISKGGLNIIENIQPLCRSCNARKSTQIVKYLPRRRRLKHTNLLTESIFFKKALLAHQYNLK